MFPKQYTSEVLLACHDGTCFSSVTIVDTQLDKKHIITLATTPGLSLSLGIKSSSNVKMTAC